MEMTQRRQQICDFIAQFTTENGFAPTLREIGSGVGIASTAAVQYQILALERAGALSRKEGYSRTLVLSPEFRMGTPKRGTCGGRASRGTGDGFPARGTHPGLSQPGATRYAK